MVRRSGGSRKRTSKKKSRSKRNRVVRVFRSADQPVIGGESTVTLSDITATKTFLDNKNYTHERDTLTAIGEHDNILQLLAFDDDKMQITFPKGFPISTTEMEDDSSAQCIMDVHRALLHLWNHDYVYTDLKPDNVLFIPKRGFVLIDMTVRRKDTQALWSDWISHPARIVQRRIGYANTILKNHLKDQSIHDIYRSRSKEHNPCLFAWFDVAMFTLQVLHSTDFCHRDSFTNCARVHLYYEKAYDPTSFETYLKKQANTKLTDRNRYAIHVGGVEISYGMQFQVVI